MLSYEPYARASPTHFISIPLNLTGTLDAPHQQFLQMARPLCQASWKDSLAVPSVKLHLTVAVMHLSDATRLEAAKALLAQHSERFAARAIQVTLRGLQILKGSRDLCRLIYAKVDAKGQAALDDLFAPLLRQLVQAGLCDTLSTKVALLPLAVPLIIACPVALHPAQFKVCRGIAL